MINSDSAEYDALGNHVGLSNTYSTQPPTRPVGDTNTDFNNTPYSGGTSSGGAPFGRQYYSDGMKVSEEFFMNEVNSGRIGGAFGLLELAARMSRGNYVGSTYSYKDANGAKNFLTDREGAFQWQAETHGEITEHRFWAVSEATDLSWKITASLIPIAQRTVTINNVKVSVKTYPHKTQLETDFKTRLKSKKCKDALDKLAAKLGYKKGIDSLYNDVVNAGNLLMAVQPFPPAIDQAGWALERTDEIVFNYRATYSENSDSTNLIHELLHLAGNGADHTRIANFMFQFSKKLGDTPISFTKRNLGINNGQPVTFAEPANKKNSKGFDVETTNRDYMNRWINTYCPN